MFPMGYTIVGVLLAGVGITCWKVSHSRGRGARWLLRLVGSGLYLLALPALVLGVYLLWCSLRPQPEPVYRPLFLGVEYRREVRRQPRPAVIHVVSVDLTAPGVGFIVTSPEPRAVGGHRLLASTTSTFVKQVNAQLAINANYFWPFYARWPWSFYPRQGDPVSVVGRAAAQGQIYRKKTWHGATLFISDKNRLTLGVPAGKQIFNAVSGKQFILRQGKFTRLQDDEPPNPVVGAGINKKGDRLILVLVDGRQPLYSEGLTIPELAATLHRHGAHDAIQLDGGGSTTLVIEGPNGEPVILNSPIHTRIPGRQRPVANHLGIFAGKIGFQP